MLCTFIVLTGAVAFTNAHFGAGAGPIYLDTIDCTGSESNLTDCFRSFIVSCSSHSEDAGVRCQGELHLDSVLCALYMIDLSTTHLLLITIYLVQLLLRAKL